MHIYILPIWTSNYVHISLGFLQMLWAISHPITFSYYSVCLLNYHESVTKKKAKAYLRFSSDFIGLTIHFLNVGSRSSGWKVCDLWLSHKTHTWLLHVLAHLSGLRSISVSSLHTYVRRFFFQVVRRLLLIFILKRPSWFFYISYPNSY